jgi:RNase P subunit RPR2
MEVIFCPKCGYPLETESVKNLKKEIQSQYLGWVECKNCKTHFNTPYTKRKKISKIN